MKVVTDLQGYALYFSRSMIPFPRNDAGVPIYKHIGIYAYRRDFLLNYAKLSPTPLRTNRVLRTTSGLRTWLSH